jgi:hypothetical protein
MRRANTHHSRAGVGEELCGEEADVAEALDDDGLALDAGGDGVLGEEGGVREELARAVEDPQPRRLRPPVHPALRRRLACDAARREQVVVAEPAGERSAGGRSFFHGGMAPQRRDKGMCACKWPRFGERAAHSSV